MKLKGVMAVLTGLLLSKAAVAQNTQAEQMPEVTIEQIRASLNVLAKAGMLEQDHQTKDLKVNSKVIEMLRDEGYVNTISSVAGSICM